MQTEHESLNLVEAVRAMNGWQGSGRVVENDKLLVSIATSDYPMGYANCIITKRELKNPEQSLLLGMDEFRKLNRQFVLWIKADDDNELEQTALNLGFREVSYAPWMRLKLENLVSVDSANDLKIVFSKSEKDIDDAIIVNRDAYNDLTVPPEEVDLAWESKSALLKDDIVVAVGYINDTPVVAGTVVLSDINAGLYWIGTKSQFRKKGYGRMATQALVQEASKKGFSNFSLQSSPFGKSVYLSMGFKQIAYTKWLLSPVL